MDTVRLVESGEYKKEDLNAVNFAFISGMEEAMRCLDGMYDEGDFESFSPTLATIQKEFADEVLRTAKEWLKLQICGAIVELSDAEAVEGEKNDDACV